MIESALREVGAARSIVIDENGLILAGNATCEAAAAAGIEKVQVIDADGETIIAVRRTGLTAAQKARLALFDNRAPELAEWDEAVLAELSARDTDGLFSDAELEAITTTPELDEIEDVDRESGPRLGKSTVVHLPVAVPDVSVVERALASVGTQNRGEALLVICRAFLGETEG